MSVHYGEKFMSPLHIAGDEEERPQNDRPTSAAQSRHNSMKDVLAVPFKKHVCFCIPISWIVLPPEGEHTEIANSNVSTVFLLLNTMIGSGIIVQAYVFSQAGIVAACIEYVVIGYMIYTGVEIIIRCAIAKQIFDYSHLAEELLGPYGRIGVDGSIVIGNAGALLSYILIIGSLFSDIVTNYSTCDAWYCNIGFLTILPIIIFTIPLCLIRNFGHLAIISCISIGVISAIICLVVIGGPVVRDYYPQHDDAFYADVFAGSYLGSIRTIGDIVFALGYIAAVFHAYNAMENKSIDGFFQVAKITTILGVLMCFFTGLAGYLSFRDSTQTNILENFPGIVGATFKLGLIAHLILYIPGDFVIMRAALWKLCAVDVHTQSNTVFISTTLTCITTITFVAIMLQLYASNDNALGLVVDITGGLSGSVIYFVIPALCGLKLFWEDRMVFWKCTLLAAFGVFIIILVLISYEL